MKHTNNDILGAGSAGGAGQKGRNQRLRGASPIQRGGSGGPALPFTLGFRGRARPPDAPWPKGVPRAPIALHKSTDAPRWSGFSEDAPERVGDNAFHLCARTFLSLALVLSLPTLSACWASDVKEKRADEPATNAVVNIAFDADCEKMLIEEINRADKEILVAIYNITRKNITSALAHAVRRGVKVRLKYESKSHSDSEKMNDAIDYLEGKGVECTPIRMPDKEGIMHDKFTVIDRKRVLTGSFNYTSSASTVNYENLVLIESPAVAKRYIEEFEKIKSKQ